jgi:hypothetical protein
MSDARTVLAELIQETRNHVADTPMYADDAVRLRRLADALEAEHAEVERLRAEADANWPCDGGCNVNDGPEETCSRHGRRVSEVWQMAHDAMQRAERAEAAVEAVLALHRDDAGTCVECSQGRSVTFPCPTLWAISDALLASEPSGSER